MSSNTTALWFGLGQQGRECQQAVCQQDALGAAQHVQFESCSDHIGAILGPDVMKSVMFLLPDILKSVPLLLYQGLHCGPNIHHQQHQAILTQEEGYALQPSVLSPQALYSGESQPNDLCSPTCVYHAQADAALLIVALHHLPSSYPPALSQ